VSVDLDEFLTDSTRRDFLLSVAKKSLGHTEPAVLRTGELFIDLLAGNLKTTVSSPVDYLETGANGSLGEPNNPRT
jgi:hypothetical protein